MGDLVALENVLGMACTFFMSWKGIMAGMECIPEGTLLLEVVLDEVVPVFVSGEEPFAGFGLGTGLELRVLGLSEFTLT